jgi:hypothetical protein
VCVRAQQGEYKELLVLDRVLWLIQLPHLLWGAWWGGGCDKVSIELHSVYVPWAVEVRVCKLGQGGLETFRATLRTCSQTCSPLV